MNYVQLWMISEYSVDRNMERKNFPCRVRLVISYLMKVNQKTGERNDKK